MGGDIIVTSPDGRVAKLPPDAEDWESLLTAFIEAQDIRDSSKTTYRWAMGQYYGWLKKTGRSLKGLTAADVGQFKNWLLKSGHSPLTVGVYLAAVRQFYSWTETNLMYPNIAVGIHPPRNKKGFRKMHLTEEEAADLLEYEKGISKRNYALVNLILRTGLRTVEIVRADVGDVTFMRGRRVLKVWGKGCDTKDEIVILSDPAWIPLKEYLDSRPNLKPGMPLFVTDGKGHRGKRMSTRSVQLLCKSGMEAIGLEGHEYSAHSLRHTTAVSILKNGGDWKDVQRVLRHASPVTSQIYTASVEEEIRLDRAPEQYLDNAFKG